MTAFNPAMLPASVNTLEKLVVWAGAAFYKINQSGTAVEGTGSPTRIAQFGVFNVESNNTNRVILRQSLEIDNNYAFDKNPIWLNVNEINSIEGIPAYFLSETQASL